MSILASAQSSSPQYVPSPAQGPVARSASARLALAREQQAPRLSPPPYEGLPPDLGVEVAGRWPVACEDAFEFLASVAPGELLLLIASGTLGPQTLTIAAEVAGGLPDSRAVRSVLLPLLRHPAPVVREGAIYGLARHVDAATRSALDDLFKADASAAVRSAARDALDQD